MLRLSSAINYDAARQAISLVESLNHLHYETGNTVRVSGWGWQTPYGYDPSNCLQGVDVNIISTEEANNIFISYGIGQVVSENEFATAGIGSVRQGACHGDSGGPVSIWDSLRNSNVLLGIVSWGRAKMCWKQ